MKTAHKVVASAAMAAMFGACASSSDVNRKIADVQAQQNKKIESVETQIEDLQQKQKQTDVRLDAVSQEAKDALKRAQEAGVLAKGKVVFQQTFSEDRVKFKSGSYDLDKEAKRRS